MVLDLFSYDEQKHRFTCTECPIATAKMYEISSNDNYTTAYRHLLNSHPHAAKEWQREAKKKRDAGMRQMLLSEMGERAPPKAIRTMVIWIVRYAISLRAVVDPEMRSVVSLPLPKSRAGVASQIISTAREIDATCLATLAHPGGERLNLAPSQLASSVARKCSSCNLSSNQRNLKRPC
jgi:hypothetical protein